MRQEFMFKILRPKSLHLQNRSFTERGGKFFAKLPPPKKNRHSLCLATIGLKFFYYWK